jgi:RNA polymerase sigma-70 factor, ECF subfamily
MVEPDRPAPSHQLAPLFLASLNARRRGSMASAEDAALEAALAAAVASATTAWPTLRIDARTFVAYLAARVGDVARPQKALAEMRVADLYLACACLMRVPGAVALLDREARPMISEYLARLEVDPETEAEVVQSLFVRLLVPDPQRPSSLADYEGRSTLGKWLGVSAQRVVLNGRRADDARSRLIARLAEQPVPPVRAAEDSLLRERHKKTLEAAIAEAVAALPKRDRIFMKMHVVSRVPIAKIARMFLVDPRTISRQLARAHRAVWAHVRKRLGSALRLSPPEVDSFVRGLQSQLDISLSGALDSGPVRDR